MNPRMMFTVSTHQDSHPENARRGGEGGVTVNLLNLFVEWEGKGTHTKILTHCATPLSFPNRVHKVHGSHRSAGCRRLDFSRSYAVATPYPINAEDTENNVVTPMKRRFDRSKPRRIAK